MYFLHIHIQTNKKNNFEIAAKEFSFENYKNGLDGKNSLFYQKFWGGEKNIKTEKEIQAIFEVSERILKKSKGFRKNFDKAVISTMLYYKENQDLLHYNILKDALGKMNKQK